jgi:hypothetical protein
MSGLSGSRPVTTDFRFADFQLTAAARVPIGREHSRYFATPRTWREAGRAARKAPNALRERRLGKFEPTPAPRGTARALVRGHHWAAHDSSRRAEHGQDHGNGRNRRAGDASGGGRILAGNVAEVERACRSAMAAGQHLVLDLGGVSYLDGIGAAMLRALPPDRRSFSNCSEFLEQLLGLLCGSSTPTDPDRRLAQSEREAG